MHHVDTDLDIVDVEQDTLSDGENRQATVAGLTGRDKSKKPNYPSERFVMTDGCLLFKILYFIFTWLSALAVCAALWETSNDISNA